MKKIILLLFLVSSMFLFFGCTETENNTNQTNNQTIDLENQKILYFFYDPSWNLTEYNTFLNTVEEKLPSITIEKKCIDLQKYFQNTTSASEELCVEEIGYISYNKNMKLANELNMENSNFILKVPEGSAQIPFTPVSTMFIKKICLEDNTLEGCDSLEELPKLPVKIILDNSSTEDYSELYTFFENLGLPFEIETIDYTSDEGKEIISTSELSTIPVLFVDETSVSSISEEQTQLLQQLVMLGQFEQSGNNLIIKLPGTEKYVGPKYEEANVELFIMSYCPYGLQSQKAIIPVKEAFGNELNLTIRFVDYIMHGKEEIDENNIQYCIQKENEDVFYTYLSCFTNSGNSTDCLGQVNITEDQLQPCITELDETYNITAMYEDQTTWSNGRFPQYLVDTNKNELYAVRGSPTLVFNGKQMSWPRSPEGIKQGICNLLETPPEVCETELDSNSASPGFGGTTTSASTSATCG